MERHPFDNQISTRMSVATDGTYTRAVEGLPVEGEEKLAAVRRFGDSRFGPGNWELAYAYGDHHSDRAVLSAAEHPRAVSPDRPLARTARERLGDPRLVEPCAHTLRVAYVLGFLRFGLCGGFLLG